MSNYHSFDVSCTYSYIGEGVNICTGFPVMDNKFPNLTKRADEESDFIPLTLEEYVPPKLRMRIKLDPKLYTHLYSTNHIIHRDNCLQVSTECVNKYKEKHHQ